MESISTPQARKLALLSQGLPNTPWRGQSGTLEAIQHLGYIQIDSISVVTRAHHHTLWTRVKNYRPEHIDTLLKQGKIFEYWSHAAAYLPIEDFRYSLPKKAYISGQRHWFERDKKVEKEVLARIRAEGPLQAKDFQKPDDHEGGWWQWKPAKQALEQLFMSGELMCPKRIGFQKVYELTERALPFGIDTSMPSESEMARHLIEQALRSHGLVQFSELGYLRKNMKQSLRTQVQAMKEEGHIIEVKLGEHIYITTPSLLASLNKPLSRKKIKLLSPFDNLVIQRNRIQQLFEFDYRIECYVPADKREFGYYVLPVLWQGELIARLDAKADRKNGVFHINKLVLEKGFPYRIEDFSRALIEELESYARFNDCCEIEVHNTLPQELKHFIETHHVLKKA